jgi:hypothetical protein
VEIVKHQTTLQSQLTKHWRLLTVHRRSYCRVQIASCCYPVLSVGVVALVPTYPSSQLAPLTPTEWQTLRNIQKQQSGHCIWLEVYIESELTSPTCFFSKKKLNFIIPWGTFCVVIFNRSLLIWTGFTLANWYHLVCNIWHSYKEGNDLTIGCNQTILLP